ncbi:hypothetical protein F4802DRAFT_561542 [Xylaria palmicola]|nr:hypothetical protein F4802DRAFT_561542 [Xylaria palmicola]
MRPDALATLVVFFITRPGAHSLPLTQQTALSRRLDSSTCEFYGYVSGTGVYNEYTIKMAGWGNDGSVKSCAIGIPGYIQTQCRTGLDHFACTQIYENLHDTQISFRLNKAAIAQPDCVTQALGLASSLNHDEQSIKCVCLAECWQSHKRRQESDDGHKT